MAFFVNIIWHCSPRFKKKKLKEQLMLKMFKGCTRRGRETKEPALFVSACPSVFLWRSTSFRSRGLVGSAAAVTGLSGVGLSSQAPRLETKSRDTVGLLYPHGPLASTREGTGPAAPSQVSVGNTHVRLTRPATGCEHAPLRAREAGLRASPRQS